METRSRRLRATAGTLAVLLLAGCKTGPRTQSSYDDLSYFTVGAGGRLWDSSWKPVEDPLAIQLSYSYEPEAWPVGIEAAFNWASKSDSLMGSGITSNNLEGSIGAAKSFWPVSQRLLWSFGAGLAFTYSSERLTIFDPDDPGNNELSATDIWPGLYGHTRLAWKFSQTFDIGVDLRGLTGGSSISLIGPVRAGQYVQLTIGLGIHY